MTFWTLTPVEVGVFDSFPLSRFLHGYAEDQRVRAPCISWIARGRDGRVVIIDTGPPVPTAESQAVHQMLTVEPHHRIDRAIESVGIGPEEVSDVIFTHLHFDHCSGAEHLPRATCFAMKEDLRYGVWPDDDTQRVGYEVGYPGITPAWMSVFDRMQALDAPLELATGMRIVPLPGHTPGSLGVIIDTQQGRVALTGDLVNRVENWSAPGGGHIPPSMYTDLAACHRAFSTLEVEADHVPASHDFRTLDRQW